MIVTYMGSRSVDFSNERGDKVKGTTLFIAYPDDGVNGLKTDKVFLKETIGMPSSLKSGDKLDIAFNSKGKAVAVSSAKV